MLLWPVSLLTPVPSSPGCSSLPAELRRSRRADRHSGCRLASFAAWARTSTSSILTELSAGATRARARGGRSRPPSSPDRATWRYSCACARGKCFGQNCQRHSRRALLVRVREGEAATQVACLHRSPARGVIGDSKKESPIQPPLPRTRGEVGSLGGRSVPQAIRSRTRIKKPAGSRPAGWLPVNATGGR